MRPSASRCKKSTRSHKRRKRVQIRSINIDTLRYANTVVAGASRARTFQCDVTHSNHQSCLEQRVVHGSHRCPESLHRGRIRVDSTSVLSVTNASSVTGATTSCAADASVGAVACDHMVTSRRRPMAFSESSLSSLTCSYFGVYPVCVCVCVCVYFRKDAQKKHTT